MKLGRGTEASGDAAVAIQGDAHQPVLTNPTFINVNVSSTESPPPPGGRLRLLPPHVADFTGREEEIEQLGIGIADNFPAYVAITGKPGVGKTSLAVHLAYSVHERYADGDLYVDLRGVDKEPTAPEEVMGRFMRALGVPEQEIPSDRHVRLDAYRRTVADRPLVIVLDNAHNEAQVRPLVPPGAAALVLVTSRNQLRGLEGAQRIDLDTFPTATSHEFLRKIVGEDAVTRDPDATQDVITACGHLPLALRIAANRLQTTRNMHMANLAVELRDQRRVLGALEAGDLAVRAAFNLSHRNLGKSAKSAFKRLSLVPGTDFGAGICSALLDCGEQQARKALNKLEQANLIEASPNFGRFKFHDLLRVYSSEKREEDAKKKNDASISRMLEWVRNSCIRSSFAFIGKFGELQAPTKYYAEINSIESAISWCRAELENAVSAISVAMQHEGPEGAETLAMSLTAVCEFIGAWDQWEDVINLGLEASSQSDTPDGIRTFLGSKANLARSRRDFSTGLEIAGQLYSQAIESEEDYAIGSAANLLGCLKMDSGELTEALPLIEQGLEIFSRLGIQHEVGQALYNLGAIHRAVGNTHEAIRYFKQDLAVCIESGDELGAAETLNTIGLAHVELGELKMAEKLQRDSLDRFKKIGNVHKISMVINDLGLTLRRQGRAEEALALYMEDIELSRSVGNESGAALAQSNAGEALHSMGRDVEADKMFNAAISVFAEIGDEDRLSRSLLSQVPLLFSTGEVDLAESNASRAIEALMRRGDFRDAAAAHQVLSYHYAKIFSHEDSLRHAEKSIAMEDSFDAPYFRALSYMLAMKASLGVGDTSRAEEYSAKLQSFEGAEPGLADELIEEFEED